jgi:hypothetical protein
LEIGPEKLRAAPRRDPVIHLLATIGHMGVLRFRSTLQRFRS